MINSDRQSATMMIFRAIERTSEQAGLHCEPMRDKRCRIFGIRLRNPRNPSVHVNLVAEDGIPDRIFASQFHNGLYTNGGSFIMANPDMLLDLYSTIGYWLK